MSVIVNVNSAASYYGASTLSLPVGDNIDGDMIVIAYRIRSTGATISCTGFTHTYSATTSSWKTGFLYKVNSGSATTSPLTVSSTASSYFVATAYVIRGQHASPIGNTANSNSGSSRRLTSATLTTSGTNSLILHSFAGDQNFQPEIGTHSMLSHERTDSGYCISGADFVAATSASVPTFYWNAISATQCVDAILEIKSASGSVPVSVSHGRTVVSYHGGFDNTTPTYTAPNSVSGLTAIKGVSLSTSAATVTNSALLAAWKFVGLYLDTSAATTQWDGVFETVSLNLTGKVLTFPWVINRGTTDGRIGTQGMICVLADSSNNWVAYTLRDMADGWLSATNYTAFIKYGSTPVLESSLSLGGTEIDISSVVKIGFFTHRLASGGAGNIYLNIGPLSYESSATVATGGSAAVPLTAALIARNAACYGQWQDVFPLQGKGQYMAKISLQIGDGSVPTYFKSTGQSFEYPAANGVEWTLADGDVGITLKASASCTMDLSASIFSAASLQSFAIDAASSISATYNFVGASFIGLNWAANAAIDFSSASYTQCNLTELGGGTVTNSSITSPVGASSATVSASGGELDNVSISVVKASGANADYHLTYGTSVTSATLTDVAFVGTPVVDKVRVLRTTGTVTININGTTSLGASDVTSAGATVSIVSSPVYQKVTVPGFTAGSRLQIYDTSSSTELFNGTATAGNTVITGTTAVWTDPATSVSSRNIRVRISKVAGATADLFQELAGLTCGVTSGYEITYPVTPSDDDVYNANAINGSTVTGVTFTDAATDLVNIDVASNAVTWPQIYAAFVYWISTASGIADDIAYIQAKDTANYTLTSMKIKNTSSPMDPLVVSGGYGIDSTTGTSLPLVDTTGGTLIFAPDHVVAYQTTGTYAITGDISTVLAAIPSDTDNAAAVRTNLATELARIDVATSTRLATAGYTAPDNAGIADIDAKTEALADIQAKTDQLTFTTGKVHADTKSMNGAAITGTGTSGDKWRGV